METEELHANLQYPHFKEEINRDLLCKLLKAPAQQSNEGKKNW